MNKDLKYMPIDNRATTDGTPFRNNAIKKMESSALFNHVDGHPKPKVDEFGNPIPKGFKSDIKGETGGSARTLESLKKEFETKMSGRQSTPSKPGPDRLTQFQAQKSADAFNRLTRTDPDQAKRISSIAKKRGMQSGDISKMNRLQELRIKRMNIGGSAKK
tara:strand:+ start:3678 stop:4160 length:483 start_codon:yes stop_codon:yes gene_type:complete